jgi:hypothetical protein
VASPDERHWGSTDFIKDELASKSGIFLYFPVWSIDEILAAASYFPTTPKNLTLSEDEIKYRFSVIGGVPRYIFGNQFQKIKKEQIRALGRLSPQSVDSISFDASVIENQHTSDLPKGLLLSYKLADHDQGTYEEGCASLCSYSVYKFIAKKFMKHFWASIVTKIGSFDTGIYEAYTIELFYDQGGNPESFTANTRDCVGTYAHTHQTDISIGGCYRMERVEYIVQAAIETEMVLFTPISTTNKLIDFIYRDGHV